MPVAPSRPRAAHRAVAPSRALARDRGLSPVRHRAALTLLAAVALTVITAASALLPSASALAADPVPPRPDVVILLDGLCSSLAAGDPYTTAFAGDDGIAQRLVDAGIAAESVIGYGYRGGAVDGSGTWRPEAYACEDSRDQSLARDVDALATQVEALAAAHPGARFRLIGFSQGGLVAFAWLARLIATAGWPLPNGATLDTVVTLDSPLGGLPFVEIVCGLAPDVCGGRASPADDSTLRDMGRIWDTASGHPAGATRSIASDVTTTKTANEAIATAAAAHGVRVLTVGNVRDWLYAPAGPNAGTLAFLDTQWLTTQPDAVGVYSRAIDSGPSSCPLAAGDLAASYGCNHPLVLHDAMVFHAIAATLAGSVPPLADSCPPGRGNCLALPPRPSTLVTSRIAPGIVSGGGHFSTSAALVRTGGRATILFTTSPGAAGKPVQIWGRSKTGQYRFMTTRIADRKGIVRYYTPPITGWAAIQARYAGDFVNGPGISPARVVTIR